jgi:hypothetical protein
MIRPLAWGARVDAATLLALRALIKAFYWQPVFADWLMACMAFETGESFSPSVRNKMSGATGAIQFMPLTAAGLGVTCDALARMTFAEQMHYVQRYFAPYAHRIASLNDMYVAILLPSAIGKPDSTVLFSGGVAYRENAGLDANTDGVITKAEAAARVAAKLPKGLLPENTVNIDWGI